MKNPWFVSPFLWALWALQTGGCTQPTGSTGTGSQSATDSTGHGDTLAPVVDAALRDGMNIGQGDGHSADPPATGSQLESSPDVRAETGQDTELDADSPSTDKMEAQPAAPNDEAPQDTAPSVASSEEAIGSGAVEAPGFAPIEQPPGTVLTFVATSHGGWSAMSCDGGETWTSEERTRTREDHGQYAGFAGSAYTGDGFVVATGWSGSGQLWLSATGADFRELDLPAGVGDFGAVVRYGDQLAAFRGSQASASLLSSTGGTQWTVGGRVPEGASQVRKARGFDDGLLLMVSSGENSEFHVSQGDPESWRSTVIDGDCIFKIQRMGGLARVGERIVVGASSGLCVSRDLGRSFEKVSEPAGEFSALFEDGSAFYAFQGQKLWRSTDGQRWSAEPFEFANPIDEGACFQGTCMAVPFAGGASYRREPDGTWVEAGTVPAAGFRILSLAAGYVKPGPGC